MPMLIPIPKLRSYRPSDLTAMVALDRMCFPKEFCFEVDSMRRFAEEGKAVAVVAEELDGELAGFVIAEVQTARGVSHGYCVTLDVAEEYRRQGLGGRLLHEAERRCSELGAMWMDLHVYAGNSKAVAFYERRGYQRRGVRLGFYGKAGMDAFEYRRVFSGE